MLLYIHVPFCLHKCPYCDFNTFAVSKVPEEDYLQALLAEMDFYAAQLEWKGAKIESIFFGGGTPSLLSARTIQSLINRADLLFGVESQSEITLEANPGGLSADKLQGFRSAGINRLSLGAQTFSPALLKRLGRLHLPEDIDQSIGYARAVGFDNISLDLIYGIPDQTLSDLERDLRQVESVGVDHVSAYCLTYEQGTPFYAAKEKGAIVALPDELTLEMMRLVIRALTELEFENYEISNFAKSGYQAKHNLGYWHSKDYLGLGAGAHSYIKSQSDGIQTGWLRWANLSKPDKYSSTARAFGKAQAWSENLNVGDAVFERFFLGLRIKEGLSLGSESQSFGINLLAPLRKEIEALTEQGLTCWDGDRLTLSALGWELCDSVIASFASSCLKLAK